MAQCPRCGGLFGRDHYGDDIGHVRYCRHCGPRFTPAQRDAIAGLKTASMASTADEASTPSQPHETNWKRKLTRSENQ